MDIRQNNLNVISLKRGEFKLSVGGLNNNIPYMLLVSWTENHLSSFKCGFLKIFRAKTCCVVCQAYCFCYGGTKMARKNV